MEGTLVSARVSKAKKDAGVNVLDSIGVSTTELINCAFDYVLEHKALPRVEAASSLSKEDAISDFGDFVAKSTISVDWSVVPCGYKEIIREGKAMDYESLA
jgi:antitoxin component of RelBE/YafQ-DinJ toxin-antitoxin module